MQAATDAAADTGAAADSDTGKTGKSGNAADTQAADAIAGLIKVSKLADEDSL